jgi:hypothetical protein
MFGTLASALGERIKSAARDERLCRVPSPSHQQLLRLLSLPTLFIGSRITTTKPSLFGSD